MLEPIEIRDLLVGSQAFIKLCLRSGKLSKDLIRKGEGLLLRLGEAYDKIEVVYGVPPKES